MAELFGAIGLQDSDRLFNNTIGQQVIYEETDRVLGRYNLDVSASLALFLEEDTEKYKERYKLPGNGRLQKRGRLSRPGAVKAFGQWDVAYGMDDYGAGLVEDDVTMAYMTLAEYERHVKTVLIQDANTTRSALLQALLTSTNRVYADELYGDLTVKPLANGDADTYPPVLGSEAEATRNRYHGVSYAASAISDTNDPYATIVGDLEGDFGTPTGGSPIAIFVDSTQVNPLAAMTDFTPVQHINVHPGTQTAVPNSIPAELLAGTWRVLGTIHNAWVCEWRFFPASYALGVHLSAPKPLKRRVDAGDTGIPRGLHLASRTPHAPFETAYWRNRFGFGVGNRLNGSVVFMNGSSATYTDPSI